MKKLLLIDGNSIMNRGYYALPPNLTAPDGTHTNAVLGFLNIFLKLYDEEKPGSIVVAFDRHEPTFRHKLYAEYKGTRHGMDDELREQFPLIKDILHTMGITTCEISGIEADDIIGTYSVLGEKAGYDVVILSGDRDLLQLATNTVHIKLPKMKEGRTVTETYYDRDVQETYGVTPKEFIEMKGLMGDTSDNIPGVRGIGEKTASKLISQYHSIEAIYEDIDNVKPAGTQRKLADSRDIALFSRNLATIKCDCEVDVSIENAAVERDNIYSGTVRSMLLRLNLKSVTQRHKFSTEDNTAGTPESAPGAADRMSGDEGIFSGAASGSSKMGSGYDRSVVSDIADISGKYIIQKPLGEIEIPTPVSMTVGDILEDIEKTSPEYIGIWPVELGGECKEYGGFAAAYADKCVFTSDADMEAFRRLLRYPLVMMSVKEHIDTLGLTADMNIFDISVAEYLISPLDKEYTYNSIALRYFGNLLDEEKNLYKTEATVFSFYDESFIRLIGYKAYVAYAAYKPVTERLKALGEWELYESLEHPLTFVLRDMERLGIRASADDLEQYGENIRVRVEQLTKQIYELAGHEFKINSPKQLGVVLFEEMGLRAPKKTKSGYSTAADVLMKLRDDSPIIPLILEYRQLSKLISTYVDGLLPTIGSDGRIHSTFNQVVTATGRISSTEPNLQNIPTRSALGREIRKVFIPEKGYTFVDADYSQIELRVMASVSGDASLIEAFNEGKDIHAITASQVFNVPLDEVTPELRRSAKAVNFGIIYGISSFGLGEDLSISRKDAQSYIDKYFETYPGVKRYLDEKVAEAKELGAVKTLMGRIRPIPEINSSVYMTRQFGERVAMNSPIQGTAADIIKLAMIRVSSALRERGLRSRLILQIHDELLIEAAKDEVDEVKELLRENMEGAMQLSVKLLVDIHTGGTLYDAK